MNWRRFLPKKFRTQASEPLPIDAPPNVQLRGHIERIGCVMYVNEGAHNYYAITLKEHTGIIVVERPQKIDMGAVCLALLQPGDYVEVEINSHGWGQLSSMKSSAWVNKDMLKVRNYHDPRITPSDHVDKLLTDARCQRLHKETQEVFSHDQSITPSDHVNKLLTDARCQRLTE